jgi:hypothetical protein
MCARRARRWKPAPGRYSLPGREPCGGWRWLDRFHRKESVTIHRYFVL